MDERHTQIREGAGLDEARLNIEFIDFLKKWSTPVLVIIAVIALGYFGLQKWREARKAALAAAFVQLDAARDSGNPMGLLAIAEEHRGQGAVAEMALLHAADIYLGSARAGIRPEGRIDGTGNPEDPTHLLTEEERTKQLDRAAELYQQVVSSTTGKMDMAQHTIGGLYGLAAVAESRGKLDEARRQYDAIEVLARAADMPEHIELVKQRVETLGVLANMPRLYAKAELPQAVSGSLPEGFQQISNPFATTGPAPEGPVAPPATDPAPAEPEAGVPGATPPPGETPSGTTPPGQTPPVEKPADPPAPQDPPKPDPPKEDPPKQDPGR